MSLLDLLAEQPAPNTPGDANAIANAFAEIMAVVNGGLDTANWGAGKIFPPSKLTQESAVDGDGLAFDNASGTWKRTTDKPLRIAALAGYPADVTKFLAGDGTWIVPSVGVSVNDRALSTVDIANSAVEASAYSKAIAANAIGTNKMLRAMLIGDMLYNNNVADTLRLRVKFGGTTFFDDIDNANAALSATRRPFIWEVWVVNLGATNSQMILTRFTTAFPGATTGIGDFQQFFRNLGAGTNMGMGGISTLGTIDTTAIQTLDLTATWSAASANDSFRTRAAFLELLS